MTEVRRAVMVRDDFERGTVILRDLSAGEQREVSMHEGRDGDLLVVRRGFQATPLRIGLRPVLFSVVLCGCALLRPGDAVQTCQDVARGYGADFRVVGSFVTTVAGIRALTPGGAPGRWTDLPPEQAAVLCYLDGPVAKSPPGGDPYDRAVVGVALGHSELIIAGYRNRLPMRAP